MIKAILFDFGQTLVDSAEGFKEAEREAKHWIRGDLFGDSEKAQQLPFLEKYREIRKSFHERSIFSRPSIWEAVYRRFGRIPDPEQLCTGENRYWETVKAFTKPFPETARVLEQMANTHRLALISNTQGQQSTGTHRLSLFPRLEHFFEVIIIAGEGEIPPKPDAKPFTECLSHLGLAPAEAVYVGDDWRIDIQGARNAGLHAVWLKHHTVQRNWPEVDATVPVITRLDQLSETVKALSRG